MKKKPPPAKSPRAAASSKAQLPLRPSGTAPAEADTGEPSAAPRHTLKLPEVLAELEAAAKALEVRLTYEAIGGELGAGGLCKVKGQWRAIFDKRTTPSERVGLLAPILLRFPLEGVPLAEPVRELLARMRPSPPSAGPEGEAAAATAPDLGTESNIEASAEAEADAEAEGDAEADADASATE